jgi:hypothetical protein
MEGTSIFEVSYINTDASRRRERCTRGVGPSKNSMQQSKR